MKRKLSRAQGLVEYALLLTMVTIPMIVIYATLGDAAGEVWQAVIDGLSDTNMFEVKEYSLGSTSTSGAGTEVVVTTETTSESPTDVPTATNTVDPYGPPTETPVDTEIPTATEIPPTATHFIPATYTFTASPVPPTETPTDVPPTETPTETATPVPTATPSYVRVNEIKSDWTGDTVFLRFYVDKKNVDLTINNITLNNTQVIACNYYCELSYTIASHDGGYVIITTKSGDDIKYYYPARSW